MNMFRMNSFHWCLIKSSKAFVNWIRALSRGIEVLPSEHDRFFELFWIGVKTKRNRLFVILDGWIPISN